MHNLTPTFHLCGLIERAASAPKSGASTRRPFPRQAVIEAKAAFCRAHGVVHPDQWEWETKRSPEEVRAALEAAA